MRRESSHYAMTPFLHVAVVEKEYQLSDYPGACVPADLPLFFQSFLAHGWNSGIFVFHMERLVFSCAKIMEFQQLQGNLQTGGDTCRLFQVLLVIIEAGNDRDADRQTGRQVI